MAPGDHAMSLEQPSLLEPESFERGVPHDYFRWHSPVMQFRRTATCDSRPPGAGDRRMRSDGKQET